MRRTVIFVVLLFSLCCASCAKGPGAWWECHLCGKDFWGEHPGADILYCEDCKGDQNVSRCEGCKTHYEDFALHEGYCSWCLSKEIDQINDGLEALGYERVYEIHPDDLPQCWQCGEIQPNDTIAYVEAIDEYLCGKCLRNRLDASGVDWGRLLMEE